MNTYEIYVLIAIVAIVGVGVVLKLFPSLRTKLFEDSEELVENAEKIIPVADKAIDTVEKIAPNSVTVQALAELRQWIKIAVGNSEEDAKIGKITKGQRFDNAKAVAGSIAKDLGIELDESKEMQITAAINNFCNELGHAPQDVKAIQDELEKVKADLLNANTKSAQLEADKQAVLVQFEEVKKQKNEVVTQLKVIQGAVTGLTNNTAPVANNATTETTTQPVNPV